MQNPLLPEDIADRLKDPTTALAAVFIVGRLHPEVLLWAAGIIAGGDAQSAASPAPAKPRKRGCGRRANGAGRSASASAYLERRRAARDESDEALREAMQAAPGASIRNWAETIDRSKNSVASALNRLREAGKVENDGGRWRLTEESAPREPTARWAEPVRGAAKAVERHIV